MMTALIIYACRLGMHSPRKIAQTCRERLGSMALTGNQTLKFRTANWLQTRHLDALEGLFDQALERCREADSRLSSVIQLSEIEDRFLNPLDSIADAAPEPASIKWTLATRTGR